MTHRRLDLEIHADSVVHILESQAPDLRLSLLDTPWREMKRVYYRDPILHRIIEGGLPAVANLIMEARRTGHASIKTIPFSVDKLDDPQALAWVSAASLLNNGNSFIYSQEATDLCQSFLTDALSQMQAAAKRGEPAQADGAKQRLRNLTPYGDAP